MGVSSSRMWETIVVDGSTGEMQDLASLSVERAVLNCIIEDSKDERTPAVSEEDLTLSKLDLAIGDWHQTSVDGLPEQGSLVLGYFCFEDKKTGKNFTWANSCFVDDGKWMECRALAPSSAFVAPDSEQAKDENYDPEAISCLSTECRFGEPIAWATLNPASSDETPQNVLGYSQ
jgi:hypothetical protein